MTSLEPHIPTKLKLLIQERYLPEFDKACQKTLTLVYLDLFTGDSNWTLETGEKVASAASMAIDTLPREKTFFRLFEKQKKVILSLRQQYMELLSDADRFAIIEGDCNDTMSDALANLAKAGGNNIDLRHSPIYAFIDPYGLQLKWNTLKQLAEFKASTRAKIELFILFSDMGVARSKTNYDKTVSEVFGTDGWKKIDEAADAKIITSSQASEYRLKYFMRRLENELGYNYVRAVRFRNKKNSPFYSLVHATDMDVGQRIMDSVFYKIEETVKNRKNEQCTLLLEGDSIFAEFADPKETVFINDTDIPNGICCVI